MIFINGFDFGPVRCYPNSLNPAGINSGVWYVEGYEGKYLVDGLESTLWRSKDNGNAMLIYDHGVPMTADFILVGAHNLFEAGSFVSLSWSDDNNSYTGCAAFYPGSSGLENGCHVNEFTKTGAHRYWAFSIIGSSVTPYAYHLWWGNKLDLDLAEYITPVDFERKPTVNISDNGKVTGIHERGNLWKLDIRFGDVDATLRDKLISLEAQAGRRIFGIMWDTVTNTSDIRLVRFEGNKFSLPLSNGGLTFGASLSLVGRR